MTLSQDFPRDPYAVLDPAARWYPGDDELGTYDRVHLIPPLVHQVRIGVAAWRNRQYSGASKTSIALLNYWFNTEHIVLGSDGSGRRFQWYFAQREAVEAAIWLYEVERARDPYSLLRFDGTGRLSRNMFAEDWPRYVLKMATGTGKTKVLSLLLVWSYFHKAYESRSPLSQNFLLIAPNIIVLERLLSDFDGLKLFYTDPVIPQNGYAGNNWQDDFQPRLHIQDEIGQIAETGNIFLTNVQRLYGRDPQMSFSAPNTISYFLGPQPSATGSLTVDLNETISALDDLVIMNDEAHHIHDPQLAWFRSIQEIVLKLRQKSISLSVQIDVTATPRNAQGGIFPQTISDYPLVEAIRQNIVKTPVLPDQTSRAKLQERTSDNVVERYSDYIHLGYLEWKKVHDEISPLGRKAVLFIMAEDTHSCDAVAAHLEQRYEELSGAILTIHTKNNGDFAEPNSAKSKVELERLRKYSREIDLLESPFKAVVSVMVLREGWDVQSVVSIVGLRPFNSQSKILPEQALGRGLRRMFRGADVDEQLSVIGTDEFIRFVESIKTEGVDLEYRPMGERTPPKGPMIVKVVEDPLRRVNLNIDLPLLSARITRDYMPLERIDIHKIPHTRVAYRFFSELEQRHITFQDIDTEQPSHVTIMGATDAPSWQHVVSFFVRAIIRDLRLVGGFDVLYEKVRDFIKDELFDRVIPEPDYNLLRNLSEPEAARTLIESFKIAINALTVADRHDPRVRGRLRLMDTPPFPVQQQPFFGSERSLFDRVIGDNNFERAFAHFLSRCVDVASFIKNAPATAFRIEYIDSSGGIANYLPDFVVRDVSGSIWVVETKGREDVDDALKFRRLQQWCSDACRVIGSNFGAVFVPQADWEKYTFHTFSDLIASLVPPAANE